MTLEPRIEELMEAYAADLLTADQRRELEQLVAADAALREELRIRVILAEAVKLARKEELKEYLSAELKPHKRTNFMNQQWMFSAAAAVVILVAATAAFFFFGKNKIAGNAGGIAAGGNTGDTARKTELIAKNDQPQQVHPDAAGQGADTSASARTETAMLYSDGDDSLTAMAQMTYSEKLAVNFSTAENADVPDDSTGIAEPVKSSLPAANYTLLFLESRDLKPGYRIISGNRIQIFNLPYLEPRLESSNGVLQLINGEKSYPIQLNSKEWMPLLTQESK